MNNFPVAYNEFMATNSVLANLQNEATGIPSIAAIIR